MCSSFIKTSTYSFVSKGVQHGWDLFYTFGVPTVGHLNIAYTPRDAQVSKDTMKLISEYVRKGFVNLKSPSGKDNHNLNEHHGTLGLFLCQFVRILK